MQKNKINKPSKLTLQRKKKKSDLYPHGCLSEFHRSVGIAALCLGETVLMHDPVGFETFWRPSFVKHQRLFHANILGTVTSLDWFVSTGCLPIPRCSGTIWSNTVRVLSIPRAEEVPLTISKYRFSCIKTQR